jgi:hypothetical protein
MRNLICSIFTCFLWRRKALKFIHVEPYQTATVVYYSRPWDKDKENQIVADMAKAGFYQQTYFSGW